MKIYFYILSQGKPVGIRKIQRELGLSTPSLVMYHIKKLKEQGYISETPDGFVVSKVILEDYIKVKNSVIPKSLFNSSFIITGLLLSIVIYLTSGPSTSAFYSMIILAVAGTLNLLEALKKRSKVKF